jgi:hypothetical protein
MNEHADFLNQYLRARAREGDSILFEPPSWFLSAAAPEPAGYVAGTLVRWDMFMVILRVSSSKQGYQ